MRAVDSAETAASPPATPKMATTPPTPPSATCASSCAGSAETGAARDARLRDLDASEPTAEDAHAHAEAVSESDDE
jgi:hypothetical protein